MPILCWPLGVRGESTNRESLPPAVVFGLLFCDAS